MKTFTIPLIGAKLCLYEGQAEYDAWVAEIRRRGADMTNLHPPVAKDAGRSYGTWMWVSDKIHRDTLLHEISHFLDSVMKEYEDEWRAYTAEYIEEAVLNWRGKVLATKREGA